ncbi:putative pre-rRNA-processing protein TSR2 [Lyophyllum shimeji]|uniref:Pre-rRNA-processing protein TSR2 n=1 Tax=Lyophyllum shimeji TaxID=47721 RepID=A0A9P3UJB8_LYOSH|nr:putative pre-rRNA-processing protein TSR2 [Lyophyllum shimeji]
MDGSTAPAPSSVLFARGVIARLAVWPTLRIAVQEGWGGPGAAEKRTWLAGVIVDAFEEQAQTPDDQYIEEMLLQVMSDEYEANVEDGSAESVAVDIVRMWEETRIGKQDTVLKFEEMADKVKGRTADVQYAPTNDDDEWEDEEEGSSGEDDGEDEAPQLLQPTQNPQRNEPEVDEDGFTLVKGRGKGRR